MLSHMKSYSSFSKEGDYLNTSIPLITFFVACYNEEGNIADTLDVIREAVRRVRITYEIIIIDDASTDRSVEIIREYIDRNPEENIKLYVNPENAGLGANFGEAAFLGTGTYFRLVCGDNCEPVETIEKVLKEIGKADMILSYRPQDVAGKSFVRKILSKIYTYTVNRISGYNIKYYNGLPVFKRRDVMRWNPNAHGFGFQADLITRLLDQKATFIELPVIGVEQKNRRSKAITIKNIGSITHSLLNILIRRISKKIYEKK